jgi:CubicO group peptidase (beta-lactamase class C family)
MIFRPLLLACISLLGFAAGRGSLDQPNPEAAGMNPGRLADIHQRMQEFVDRGKAAGIVTVLARHGQLASLDAVGYRDLESKTPMSTDTLFRIMSLTKPVTCIGIMTLVDEGRLSLIDPVEKYLPEFKGQKLNPCEDRAGYACGLVAPHRPVNIEDLMKHTSGMRAPESSDSPAASLAELVAKAARMPLLFEPGTRWDYSNIGYDTLGRIIEVVTGKPYDQYVHDTIFEPLEMQDTFFYVPQEKRARVASVYTDVNGTLKKADMREPQRGRDLPSPAGGLFSTAHDLLQLNEMVRNHGTLDGKRVLSAAAVELMTTSLTGDLKAGWAPGMGHGLGWEVVRNPEGMYRYNSIGTFAKGGAYRTYEWVDASKDLVGIILMQRTNGGGDVADEINAFIAMAAAAIEQ